MPPWASNATDAVVPTVMSPIEVLVIDNGCGPLLATRIENIFCTTPLEPLTSTPNVNFPFRRTASRRAHRTPE